MIVSEPAPLRTGQVASAAGVNRETLRYYERMGLLEQPFRSPGGHRLYPASVVTTLRAIKAAQRLGFTLGQVAQLIAGARQRRGRAPHAGLQAQTRAKLAEVGTRIADLQTTRERLASILDAGCADLVACADSADCPIPFVSKTERSVGRPGSDDLYPRDEGSSPKASVAGIERSARHDGNFRSEEESEPRGDSAF